MNKKAIGTNAGIIWSLLSNSDKWDASQLMEKSGFIGNRSIYRYWLAGARK